MKFQKSMSLPIPNYNNNHHPKLQISSISLNIPSSPSPNETKEFSSFSTFKNSSFKIETTTMNTNPSHTHNHHSNKIFDISKNSSPSPIINSMQDKPTPERNNNFSSFKTKLQNQSSYLSSKFSMGPITRTSGVVDEAFYPYRIILWIFGRFPFSPTEVAIPQSHHKNNFTGTKNKQISLKRQTSTTTTGIISSTPYGYSILTWHWAYFILSSIFIGFIFITCSLGFINIFLNWRFHVHEIDEEEEAIVKDNLVAFVLFWGCLFHSTVSNVSFWRNRKRFVDYFNHWNFVMDALDIDVPIKLKRFLIFSNVWYFGFLMVVVGSYVFKFLKIARGASAMITTLSLRLFIPDIYKNDIHFHSYDSIYLFGLFALIYGIYASRSILFIYLFKTRLLRHGFKTWNGRLKDTLNNCNGGVGDSSSSELMSLDNHNEKLHCEKLYSDHYMLVNLVKQTDRVFASILQSYYASQILNMCFELYYLAKFGHIQMTKPSSFNPINSSGGTDQSDIIAAIVLLGQTVLLFFTISLDAAYVNEEAMKGFELLRSHGLHTDDSTPKKYLIYSLEMSFTQRIVLTGGKFFAIDRPFIITVLGAVFTYFIIILQFGIGDGGSSNGNSDCVSTNSTYYIYNN